MAEKTEVRQLDEERPKDNTHEHANVDVEPIVTPKTWGVVTILSLGYGLSFIPVPVMAAVGGNVAAEFNDPVSANWYIAAWITAITIGFTICGANTDMLGRRWFLIVGQGICFVGHLITGRASNATMVIAGMAIGGFGAALCQMAAFALPELLPNKWRHIGVVIADLAVYFVIIVIPVTARYGINGGDWRVNFYVGAALQGLSFLGLYFFYYPPAHPLGLPLGVALKELDYIGMVLFIGGSLPILLGIVWTAIYPANDKHVVVSLVVGFVVLTGFALWERYGWSKHPLTPTEVFVRRKGRDFTAPCIALAVINMFYYSSSIIWPTMISVCYTTGGQPWKEAAALSTAQGIAITVGALGLTFFGSIIRHWQWQQTVSVTIMVIFGSLLALATPDNMGMMMGFMIISMLGYGWAIYLCIAFTQMGVPQEQLGISGGLSGCVRFAGGAIAQAVYLSVFTNEVAKKTPELVMAAAEQAGVAVSEIPALLQVMALPSFAEDYPSAVVAAVGRAQQEAVVSGVRLIAFTSLGFGIVGIVACLCCVDVDAKMNNKIEVYLENDIYAERNAHH